MVGNQTEVEQVVSRRISLYLHVCVCVLTRSAQSLLA